MFLRRLAGGVILPTPCRDFCIAAVTRVSNGQSGSCSCLCPPGEWVAAGRFGDAFARRVVRPRLPGGELPYHEPDVVQLSGGVICSTCCPAASSQ